MPSLPPGKAGDPQGRRPPRPPPVSALTSPGPPADQRGGTKASSLPLPSHWGPTPPGHTTRQGRPPIDGIPVRPEEASPSLRHCQGESELTAQSPSPPTSALVRKKGCPPEPIGRRRCRGFLRSLGAGGKEQDEAADQPNRVSRADKRKDRSSGGKPPSQETDAAAKGPPPVDIPPVPPRYFPDMTNPPHYMLLNRTFGPLRGGGLRVRQINASTSFDAPQIELCRPPSFASALFFCFPDDRAPSGGPWGDSPAPQPQENP